MDVLADILAATRVGTAAVAQAELSAPWGLTIDPAVEAHVHVVVRGRCFLRLEGDPRFIPLAAGDVVLLRGGVGHAIVDHPRTQPEHHERALERMARRVAAQTPAQRATSTFVLCAKYALDGAGGHPLIALLPPFVHLASDATAARARLRLMLQLLAAEASERGSGADLVLPRLVDSLLVFVLRAWLDDQPLSASGWFGALRDPAIARALSLVHARPAEPWTVEELARSARQSRATFARRFVELVGEPPVSYLTRWRMCVAAKLLVGSPLSIAQVADRVGYETPAAFSRAFRRSHGVPPGRYRSASLGRASRAG